MKINPPAIEINYPPEMSYVDQVRRFANYHDTPETRFMIQQEIICISLAMDYQRLRYHEFPEDVKDALEILRRYLRKTPPVNEL